MGYPTMKSWQRLALTLMIGSFPAAVYLLNRPTQNKSREQTSNAASTQSQSRPLVTPSNAIVQKSNFNSRELNALDRGIDTKVREMKEIDIKITETRGEIIRLEEKKGSVRKDLEALQARLAPIIDGIDRRDPTGRSAKTETDDNEVR